MLGWFLCFKIAFKVASLVLLTKDSRLNILRYQGSVLYWLKSFLTLWLLTGDLLEPSRYISVVFLYLLNFCREWLLCKFLFLGDLSPHLFDLIFLCPTSQKMRRLGTIGNHPPSSLVLRCDFLKHCFLKKIVKKGCSGTFYICLFTHPQSPFKQLDPSFLGWNSK